MLILSRDLVCRIAGKMEIPICTVIFIMVVFLVLRSEGNSEKREKEKRILLNDPDLINSEIEALRREVQALTNAQTTYQSKITSLENKILQSNRGRYWHHLPPPRLNSSTLSLYCFSPLGVRLLVSQSLSLSS